jgi:hypothetical protein
MTVRVGAGGRVFFYLKPQFLLYHWNTGLNAYDYYKNYPRFSLIIFVAFPVNNIVLDYLKSMERLLNESTTVKNWALFIRLKTKVRKVMNYP